MPVLNDADAVYLGSIAVDRIYLGDVQVWPRVAQILSPPLSPYDNEVLSDTPDWYVSLSYAEHVYREDFESIIVADNPDFLLSTNPAWRDRNTYNATVLSDNPDAFWSLNYTYKLVAILYDDLIISDNPVWFVPGQTREEFQADYDARIIADTPVWFMPGFIIASNDPGWLDDRYDRVVVNDAPVWYVPGWMETIADPYESFWTNYGGTVPIESADTTDYELGNFFGVFASAAPLEIVGIRIWSGGNDTGVTGRQARLWQVADGGSVVNTLLASVDLPADLPAGWSEYMFATVITATAAADGDWYCASYSTGGRYGVLADALESSPDDGIIQYTNSALGAVSGGGSGRYTLTPGTIPNNCTHSFYIDVLYR